MKEKDEVKEGENDQTQLDSEVLESVNEPPADTAELAPIAETEEPEDSETAALKDGGPGLSADSAEVT